MTCESTEEKLAEAKQLIADFANEAQERGLIDMSAVPGLAVPTLLMGSTQVFPSVRSTNSGFNNTAAGTHTLNLPSSYSAGDLLIVLVAMQNNGTATWNTPSGWTAIPNLNNAQNGNTQGALGAFYKVATGSEGSTVDVTVSASTWRQAYNTYAIYNYTGTPEAQKSADSGSSTTVDPPSLSPSGATASTKYLFLALGAWTHSNNATDDPDGYSDAVQGQGTTATGATLRSLRKQVTGTSDNPNTFTITSSSRWLGGTIAVKGAGGAGAVPRILDSYSNVTGAWSMSRLLKSSFEGNDLYTTATGVDSLKDQSGSGINLNQSTGANQPSVLTSGVPRTAARFDGVNDLLSNAGAGIFTTLFTASAGYMAVCAVIRAISTNDATPSNNEILAGGLAANTGGIFFRNNGSSQSWGVYNHDGNQDECGATANIIDQIAVYEWRHEGGTLYGRMTPQGGTPGAWQSVVSGNTSGAQGFYLGDQVNNMQCDIFEVVTFNVVPNDTQKDALVSNMLAHYS